MTRTGMQKVMLGAAAAGLMLLFSSSVRAQETGESLFKAKCAMCHGPDGAGKSPMGQALKIPDLHSEDVQKRSDAELTELIAKGKNKMPAYEAKLSKEQITKLVGFVRDLAKKH
ncbi:MAG TPA: cytochrome c [Candidatus Acidoferrum sp.]|nr:cytochrome c [Candidatus Acidoferrum sp.]